MALRTDYGQTSGGLDLRRELDIGTSAGHVGGYGYLSRAACLGDDLRLQLVLLGIEDIMLYAA